MWQFAHEVLRTIISQDDLKEYDDNINPTIEDGDDFETYETIQDQVATNDKFQYVGGFKVMVPFSKESGELIANLYVNKEMTLYFTSEWAVSYCCGQVQ